jgi:RNA polymerase sigma factor (sigma-70 family)
MASTNPTLAALIDLARDGSAPTSERHHAFEEIVRRFQDLVFACAYARLRDPALAEDAAQDAFLLAWQRLGQLRDPAAFPGWIRRLAVTQCHRRLRGTRLQLRPEHDARDLVAAADPGRDAELEGEAWIVRLALTRLAPEDRLVLVLFYGCERSQAEIAAWLGVPVTTVSRRLAHAKRRMRQHALAGLSGGLLAHRARASESFLVDLAARIRGAEPDDAADLARLAHRLGLERPTRIAPSPSSCAYLVEDPVSGTPIAYAAALPTIFRPIYDLHLAIGERALKRHAGDVLLTQILRDLAERDAITLEHRTSARHAAVVELLSARGFEVVERAQDWRLDAGACAELAALAPSRNGASFTDLAALAHDPGLFDALLALLTEAMAEEPARRPLLPIHPDTLRRGLRLQSDGVLAFTGGRLDGVMVASADDVVPNALRVNLVLVARRRRRDGLASAMFGRLLARHRGAPVRVVAHSAGDLAAWLERRGFVRVADRLRLERLLRRTVAVASDVLDEYVGRYVVEGLPVPPIVIERYGDALLSKSRDMRDVLLASSDCEFFTRHHDGRGRFERDESGRVARLVYSDGPRQLVAIRSGAPIQDA